MKQIIIRFRALPALTQLLLLGGAARLVSVIFSKGFGWHDDHFLIIEASQSWVDGFDYNYWLPDPADPNRVPQGHSLFYVGLHYFLFRFLDAAGLHDPQGKMFVVRALHAALSLIIIKYAWIITKRHAGERTAWYTGLMMALFWFMPFMSVRNLAEFVCVPSLLMAIDRIDREKQPVTGWLIAGVLTGIAASARFQAAFIIAGLGIAVLIRWPGLKKVLSFVAGFLIVFTLTQGVVDYIIWKKPFAEFLEYVQYNLDSAGHYGTDNWHMYFDLIFGLLIPPLSIALVAGYLVSWKKVPALFWPVLVYLAFHTWFPNKQERFIMTALPLLVIAGMIGLQAIAPSIRSRVSSKVVRYSLVFVIVVNTILLAVFTPSYSKRHRVEAMYYLYRKCDSASFIIEDSNKENEFMMPPLFYYGKWFSVPGITKKYTADSVKRHLARPGHELNPSHIVFWQAENVEERVAATAKVYPGITLEKIIEPSFIDQVLFYLNPLNDNQTAFIYRIPEKKTETNKSLNGR